MTDDTLNLAIILGSTRSERQGGLVGNWIADEASKRSEFSVNYVDLRDIELPARQYDGHPKMHQYPPSVEAFSQHIAAADAFLWVTPEYNHGYPASLKHALDAVYLEWMAKPVGLVSYGGVVGGVRAQEQLRQVCGELHMVDLRDGVVLPMFTSLFNDDGTLKENPVVDNQVKLMFDHLAWWGRSLRTARAATPYPG